MNTIFNTSIKHGIKINSIIDRFHDMLFLAEQLFGERNKEYTILGIEISSNDHPQAIFIHTTKSIIIQLTEDCINEMTQAMYQASHETIHCLGPCQWPSTILEEGVPTWFSAFFMKEKVGIIFNPELISYQYAMDLVSELLSYDKDAIKKIRTLESSLSQVSSELILSVVPKLDAKTAEALASPFLRE